jgi:hypothetical protein
MKAFIAGALAGIKRTVTRACIGIVSIVKAIVGSIGPREAALLLGLSLLGYGAGYIYWAAGFILPSAVLLYVAIVGLR